MNIPIEILVLTLSSLIAAAGALIGIVVKAMSNNTEAIRDIKEWMVEKDTSEKFTTGECATRHTYITTKLKTIDTRISDIDKRLTKLEK